MLPVAVDQSSYDGVAICYVFPVLWISTFLYHGPMKHDVVQTTRLQRLVEFVRMLWLSTRLVVHSKSLSQSIIA